MMKTIKLFEAMTGFLAVLSLLLLVVGVFFR